MLSHRAYVILTFTAAVAFAAGPFVVSFDGFDPNAYPIPQDDPPAQPAGYAFSIWGVIYLWLLASTGFGLFVRPDDPEWIPTRPPLFVSLTIGAIWLPVAELSPIWATILIWAMLISALVALLRTPAKDRWLLRAPIGLYAGWLTAASSVSVALLGAGYGILFGQTVWAIIAIALAFTIAMNIITTRKSPGIFTFAVAWALVAVIVQNASTAPLIAGLAALGAAVLAGLFIYVNRTPLAQ
ncbi:hypothetical protein BOA8489_00501 [Boseongicola aestuarii]|uniref:TspO/MBR family protein n=2 Tax=Boseongicola aestuarii TaxID=1470561 RepID=A0A238IX28_9RHOB|nr:hypothetical protein BOA8489_00501 [Boseongicola aestuarii]